MDIDGQHSERQRANDHANTADAKSHSDSGTTDDCLDWRSPALSLALERVFDFFLAPDIEQRFGGHASLVARVETMRWLVAQARGPLRGSPEFRSAVRRAARSVPLCCVRFGDLYVPRWPGLAGLDRSPATNDGRSSVTLMVGLPASGKSYAALRLCPLMAHVMERASGRTDTPYGPHAHMSVARVVDDSFDGDIDRHLSSAPRGRVAVMESETQDRDRMLGRLCERGFHVVVYESPATWARTPRHMVDRVLVALGPRGSSCRHRCLAQHVAAIIDADSAALDALFATLPDYTYVWFEPVNGRFGPGRTVISLSRVSDFETADGTAPPLDLQHFL
ncbi:hypothetical protein pmac_cds_655 [Pandoravirus macleodensis]|uniref:Uncharacterized protein n=1 Tax=Pandoravirus macleodensis TaxID=2107707 RepID=A0A2U7UFT2_9VIRU|nr:hypothetical protein pmac_cds_655 [Pandoravirus macleodensis]AVK77343.1 hypothetical protein pmac_cds_655 [Pandoravirus macleodensis]UMO80101.1 hypothetical protein [Pandoravirus aubagnensis]